MTSSATFVALGLQASIFLMVLALGMDATLDDLVYLFRRPALLIRSLLSMYVILPAVVVLVVLVFDLPPAVKIALAALSISPVPPILPKKELKAGGTHAYVIGLLVAAAAISIVYAPFAAGVLDNLFRQPAHINPDKIARIVFTSILIPLVFGVAIRRWIPRFAEKVAHPLMVFALVLLAIGVIILLVAVWPHVKALIGNGTVLIIALVVLLGTVAGHLLGGPDPTNRTALALSTGARHPAVALTLATSGGADPKGELAAILLYAVIGAIILIPYVKQRPKATAGMKVD